MTKAERLARKICRATWDEAVARGGNEFRWFMVKTITDRLGVTKQGEIDAALHFALDQRWIDTERSPPCGSLMLVEEGRQMLKVKI